MTRLLLVAFGIGVVVGMTEGVGILMLLGWWK